MYYGLWKGIEGAANIAQFYVWFAFTISLFMMSDDVVRSLQEKNGLPVIPAWLDGTVDFLMVAALAWHGWMWSAAAFIAHMMLMSRMRTLVPAKKEAPNVFELSAPPKGRQP